MSRLADMMTATQSASALASGASNGLFAATRDELAPVDFQALFAQELSAKKATDLELAALDPLNPVCAKTTAMLTTPEAKEASTKAQDETQVFAPAAPNAAELIPWLPLPVQVSQSSPGQMSSPVPTKEAPFSALPGAESVQRGAPAPLSREAIAPELRFSSAPELGAAHSSDAKIAIPVAPLVEAKAAASKDGGAVGPKFERIAETVNFSATSSAAAEISASRNAAQIAASVMAAPGDISAPSIAASHAAVNTPFSAPAWREDFTQQVVIMAKAEVASAEIKLNPPQLGPIEISLSIKNDIAEANFAAASAPVREAIEASLPRLKEMFAEVGITLGNTSVSQQFGEARQTFGESASNSAQSRGSPESDSAGKGDLAQTAVIRRRSFGWVDTFA